MNGHFEFELKEDGLYLTVYPECEVSSSDVAVQLREKGLWEYDVALINEALSQKTGEPVCVGPAQEEITREAEFKVRTSSDTLTCEAWIVPPIGLPLPGPEKLRGAIHEKGVVFGLIDEEIDRMIHDYVVKEWVVVASGITPINGKDAQILYKVDLSGLRPKMRGRDSVNMKELGSIVNVLKGQELAEKIPIQKGEDGTNVLGKKIPAYIGRDKQLPQGVGVKISEDGLHLFADTDGHLRIRASKLTVEPHFLVQEDVDYSVGNIDFVGPVTVKGSIRDGFSVISGSDIVVSGVVEGATVKSQGNVLISIGIRGGGKAVVEAKGSITCGYIDQAKVFSESNILVTEAILHSDVSAKESISLLGSRKGQIVGGKIQASIEVACENLGGEMGTRTEVYVGVLPEVAEERRRLVVNIKEMKERLESICANIEFLKQLDVKEGLNNEKREVLTRLTKASFQMQNQLDVSEKRMRTLDELVARNKTEGCVRVKHTCHPGVSIHIRGLTYLVREPLHFVTFFYDEGAIQLKPFK